MSTIFKCFQDGTPSIPFPLKRRETGQVRLTTKSLTAEQSLSLSCRPPSHLCWTSLLCLSLPRGREAAAQPPLLNLTPPNEVGLSRCSFRPLLKGRKTNLFRMPPCCFSFRTVKFPPLLHSWQFLGPLELTYCRVCKKQPKSRNAQTIAITM